MHSFLIPNQPLHAHDGQFIVTTDEDWEQKRIPENTAHLLFKGYIGYFKTDFDISPFTQLQSLEMTCNNFKHVSCLRIDGMPALESIQIGKSSFNRLHFGDDINQDRSCHILRCPKLRKISFGQMAFYDYTGFELKELPALEILDIQKSCFYYGKEFTLRGRMIICVEVDMDGFHLQTFLDLTNLF